MIAVGQLDACGYYCYYNGLLDAWRLVKFRLWRTMMIHVNTYTQSHQFTTYLTQQQGVKQGVASFTIWGCDCHELGTYWVHYTFYDSRTFHAPGNAMCFDVYRAVIAVTDHQPSHVCNTMRQKPQSPSLVSFQTSNRMVDGCEYKTSFVFFLGAKHRRTQACVLCFLAQKF